MNGARPVLGAKKGNDENVQDQMLVAVVGTGSAARRHLRTLEQIDGVGAVVVARRPERFRELVQSGYTTVSGIQIAADMGVTSCIVATDTRRHAEDSMEAMRCGLDVLTEKPLAPSLREAVYLVKVATETRRKLFVGYTMRFAESLKVFRELLDRVGRLHSVRIECESYLPDWRTARPYRDSYSARADEGGVLRDLSHEIDYAGWLFGWPQAVQANVRNLGRLGIEADEIAELMWEENGIILSITLDYLSRPRRRCMRAKGELGTLEWDGNEAKVTLALVDTPVEIIQSDRGGHDDIFREQAAGFIGTQRGSHDARLVTGDEGLKAVAICDAARRASGSRREEVVKYP